MFVSQCVVLDTAMTVSEVIARLARQGYWLDPAHPVVRRQIEESAARLKLPVEEVAQKLARPFSLVGAAIHRQWYASVMWYARPVYYVMAACYQAAPGESLLVTLDLQEIDSLPALEVPTDGEVPQQEGVIVEGGTPVAVSLENWGASPADDMTAAEPPIAATSPAGPEEDILCDDDLEDWASATVTDMDECEPEAVAPPDDLSEDVLGGSGDRFPTVKRFLGGFVGGAASVSGRGHGPGVSAPAPSVAPKEVRAWPRIDAPDYVPARKPFVVTVGLDCKQQAGVTGGRVVFHPPAGAKTIDVEVILVADGLDAMDGWVRPMPVDVDNPTAAEVTFQLIGHDPPGPEPVYLTTLDLRYSYSGVICGIASRPLVIGQADALEYNLPEGYGNRWLDQPATTSPVALKVDPEAADLTIEISKPDGNPAKGSYVCRLYSPHALTCGMGPFRIDLDDDAKSFAKAIVGQVRTYGASSAVDNLLESHGRRIAAKLGSDVVAALREVANCVAPATPAVLLVSAEPYVPWELAYIDPPLDGQRPKYFGAQVLMGRWLRDRRGPWPPSGATDLVSVVAEKPPVQPPSRIGVRHMAVMAGMYKATSGLSRLPEAEAEATALQQTYNAVPLTASLQAVKQLLDANIEYESVHIGGVETIHFAGHGDYDTSNPDSAVLFLSDGMPLFASLFGSAKYGGKQSPLFFLNACMAGIGDELLGDMGGFPGNCLKGGFGGVLGALWEVDDAVAHKLALEFWQRALPSGEKKAEPVGEILRDLRAKYAPDPTTAPVTTYLSYVFYGHPRLTLQMTH